MTQSTQNPMGTDGFEFVEYTAPTAEGIRQLHTLFEMLGFVAVAKHRSKDVTLYRQGDINFLVNGTPYTHFEQFARAHGPSACAMGWRVKDAVNAYEHAVAQGAVPFDAKPGLMELRLPALYGIGSSVLYLVDRYGPEYSLYDVDFRWFDGVDRQPKGVGLTAIDHLTHNVERGTFVERHGVVQAAPAPRFSKSEATLDRPPAHAGQHTDEVLADFGFDEATVAELRDKGAIA